MTKAISPHRYINLAGISFHLSGDTEEAYSLHGRAIAMMNQLNTMNVNELEQNWYSFRFNDGSFIRVRNIFGDQQAEIYVPPRIGEKKKQKQIKVNIGRRYVPAYHTVNENGDWLGISVCLSGKWNKSPRFIRCDEDQIFDFDFGLWNDIYLEGERPDREVYVTRLFLEETTIGISESTETFYEIPAVHEFVAEINNTSSLSYAFGTWKSIDQNILLCEDDRAGGYIDGTAIWSERSEYHSYFTLFDSPDIYLMDEYPSLEDWYGYLTKNGNYKADLGSSYSSGPGACGLVTASLEDLVDNDYSSSSYLNAYSSPSPNASPGGQYWWNIVWRYGGDRVDDVGENTFYGHTQNDGVFVYYDQDNSSYTLTQYRYGEMTIDTMPNTYGSEGDTILGNYANTEYIRVFGETYELARHESTHDDTINAIVIVNPRIYIPSRNHVDEETGFDEKKICLVCAIRRALNLGAYYSFEYMMFTSDFDTEQYNDANAIFPGEITTGRHSLDMYATIDDRQQLLYGNGEFSLLRIDTYETIETEEEDG